MDFGERDDLDSAGDGAGEGIERGVEGAAEGGGDNVGYFLGGGKALGEGCALGFSELGEERVRQSVVGGAEVVETLCVADEVEGYGHFGVMAGCVYVGVVGVSILFGEERRNEGVKDIYRGEEIEYLFIYIYIRTSR